MLFFVALSSFALGVKWFCCVLWFAVCCCHAINFWRNQNYETQPTELSSRTRHSRIKSRFSVRISSSNQANEHQKKFVMLLIFLWIIGFVVRGRTYELPFGKCQSSLLCNDVSDEQCAYVTKCQWSANRFSQSSALSRDLPALSSGKPIAYEIFANYEIRVTVGVQQANTALKHRSSDAFCKY